MIGFFSIKCLRASQWISFVILGCFDLFETMRPVGQSQANQAHCIQNFPQLTTVAYQVNYASSMPGRKFLSDEDTRI